MVDSHIIWTEKYRPQSFEDIKGQEQIVARISSLVENGNLPHLLFSGPAGVGKTSLSLVIVKKIFGDSWKDNFLELNASDERGIDVVRVKVKDFARTRALGDVPFKIIYLDESDALTKEAQQALRRTMENYTSTCRFILSCNYSSKIIDPIQSRCAIFRFKPLSKEAVNNIIDQICEREGLNIDDESRELLYKVSKGDCRKLENTLQSAASLGKDITSDKVIMTASMAQPEDIRKILELAYQGEFVKSKELLLKTMLNNGLAGLDIIKQLQGEMWNTSIKDTDKIKIIEKCGETEFHLVEGSDEFIQLESLIAFVTLCGKN